MEVGRVGQDSGQCSFTDPGGGAAPGWHQSITGLISALVQPLPTGVGVDALPCRRQHVAQGLQRLAPRAAVRIRRQQRVVGDL